MSAASEAPVTLVGTEQEDAAALLEATREELRWARAALADVHQHASLMHWRAVREESRTLARGFELLACIAEDALEAA